MGHGAEEVDPVRYRGGPGALAKAVEQFATAGDDQMNVGIAERGERVDRDVEALEMMGEIEGRDEGGDRRRRRDPEPLAGAAPVLAGAEQLRVDSVGHLDQLRWVALTGPAQVGDRVGVIGREHADAVGRGDQGRRDGVLIGLEQRPARALAHEPVLVVDEQRLRARASPQAGEQGELGSEDERIVEVHEVEAIDARDARDQRRVADCEYRLEPVHDHVPRIRHHAVGGRGEDLDVVAAARLLAGEAERRVAGPARVGREGRGQMGDLAPGAPRRRRRSVAGADEALDAGLLDRHPQPVAELDLGLPAEQIHGSL